MIIRIELTEGQRRAIAPILDRHTADDFSGAVMAQVSNTGQELAVTYLPPQVSAGLTTFISQLLKDVKA